MENYINLFIVKKLFDRSIKKDLFFLLLIVAIFSYCKINGIKADIRIGFSDEFTSLDYRWSFIDPDEGSYWNITNEGWLRISTISPPERDLNGLSRTNAPRIMQQFVRGNFMIETKISSIMDENYEGAGILIWKDSKNFFRFERTYDGEKHSIIWAIFNGSKGERILGSLLGGNINPVVIRLYRTGNSFKGWVSVDGMSWYPAGNIEFPISDPVDIGLYVIQLYHKGSFSADFDYFRVITEMHDIVINNVKLTQRTLGRGLSTRIEVTIENQGDFKETSIVNLFIKTDFQILKIQEQAVTLKEREKKEVIFNWETADFEPGNYTLIVYANPVDGELDLENNQYETQVEIVAPVIIDQSFLSTKRADVGSLQTLKFHGRWYNGSDFNGIIEVNNVGYHTNMTGWVNLNISSLNVGREVYLVTGIIINRTRINYEQGLNQTIIWDKVIINLRSQRIDVGRSLNISYYAYYAFDEENFLGLVILNDTVRAENSIGKRVYRVTKIIDHKYNLSAYDANEAIVIWDEIELTLIVPNTRVSKGSTAQILCNGTYKFDGTPFSGTIILNDTLTKNRVGRYGYTVASVNDSLFQLTKFKSNEVYCIFDSIRAEYSVFSLIPGSYQVTVRLTYNYDNSQVNDAIVRVNDAKADNLGNGLYSVKFFSLAPSLSIKLKIEKDEFEKIEIKTLSFSFGNIISLVTISLFAFYKLNIRRQRRKKHEFILQTLMRKGTINFEKSSSKFNMTNASLKQLTFELCRKQNICGFNIGESFITEQKMVLTAENINRKGSIKLEDLAAEFEINTDQAKELLKILSVQSFGVIGIFTSDDEIFITEARLKDIIFENLLKKGFINYQKTSSVLNVNSEVLRQFTVEQCKYYKIQGIDFGEIFITDQEMASIAKNVNEKKEIMLSNIANDYDVSTSQAREIINMLAKEGRIKGTFSFDWKVFIIEDKLMENIAKILEKQGKIVLNQVSKEFNIDMEIIKKALIKLIGRGRISGTFTLDEQEFITEEQLMKEIKEGLNSS